MPSVHYSVSCSFLIRTQFFGESINTYTSNFDMFSMQQEHTAYFHVSCTKLFLKIWEFLCRAASSAYAFCAILCWVLFACRISFSIYMPFEIWVSLTAIPMACWGHTTDCNSCLIYFRVTRYAYHVIVSSFGYLGIAVLLVLGLQYFESELSVLTFVNWGSNVLFVLGP